MNIGNPVGIIGGGKKGCAGTKKASCKEQTECVWVPSKGCRVADNVPLAVLAKIAEKASAKCDGAKKSKCGSTRGCVWVPSGCKAEDDVPLAVLAKIAAKAATRANRKA